MLALSWICVLVLLPIIQCTTVSQTFSYTGAEQTYTVPSGVSQVTVSVYGAPGGSGFQYGVYYTYGDGYAISGGKGELVQATCTVSAGTLLYVYVGGAGTSPSYDSAHSTVAGGYNGGGGGKYSMYAGWGGGGGGGSDIRIAGSSYTNRIVAAGGGGGGGCYCSTGTGGNAGYSSGSSAGSCDRAPGSGASGSTGGSGGVWSSSSAGSGSLGTGGTTNTNGCGGGGGGGYYGGGAGYWDGGGGGDSYVDGTYCSNSGSSSSSLSYGQVSISFTAPPSVAPTKSPTMVPTKNPTLLPTCKPTTILPTIVPTVKPTTTVPTIIPTIAPTVSPSRGPTVIPTIVPSVYPTKKPTVVPSVMPTAQPSELPTEDPTLSPTIAPSVTPTTINPTIVPSVMPSESPTLNPTLIPSLTPSLGPTVYPTESPFMVPTVEPSVIPTFGPSEAPSVLTPSLAPIVGQSGPAGLTSPDPTATPSVLPSVKPSLMPSVTPSLKPSETASDVPSAVPVTLFPSVVPSMIPTELPSVLPSTMPSVALSQVPTICPSDKPSLLPTVNPTVAPTVIPTSAPSVVPTIEPSLIPTLSPSELPSASPSVVPTALPSELPSVLPSVGPSEAPSFLPTALPTALPSEPEGSGSEALALGTVIGISIGGTAVLVLGLVGLFVCRFKGAMKKVAVTPSEKLVPATPTSASVSTRSAEPVTATASPSTVVATTGSASAFPFGSLTAFSSEVRVAAMVGRFGNKVAPLRKKSVQLAQPKCPKWLSDFAKIYGFDESKLQKYVGRSIAKKDLPDLLLKKFGSDGLPEKVTFAELVAYCAERTDAFLTHNWGKESDGFQNHQNVAEINRLLRAEGLVTWFDSERMTGDIKDKMREGIDCSTCIVAFITKDYMKKVEISTDNCSLEFKYACNKKSNTHIIPVVMEPQCTNTIHWTGRVAWELSGRLYVDMSKGITPEKVSELRQQIITVIKEPMKDLFKECLVKIKNSLTDETLSDWLLHATTKSNVAEQLCILLMEDGIGTVKSLLDRYNENPHFLYDFDGVSEDDCHNVMLALNFLLESE